MRLSLFVQVVLCSVSIGISFILLILPTSFYFACNNILQTLLSDAAAINSHIASQMSEIRNIQRLNNAELEEATPFNASWHQDYKDTAWVFIGRLPPEMNEMDILIMFSQYGVPVSLKLVRDAETGVSRRFAFLKYEDFRSAVLAVDNFNGYEIIPGSKIQVDHVRYRRYRYADEDDANIEWDTALKAEMEKDMVKKEDIARQAIEDKSMSEKAGSDEVDEDLADPMAKYLAKENPDKDNHPHHHHHHHHHRHHHLKHDERHSSDEDSGSK